MLYKTHLGFLVVEIKYTSLEILKKLSLFIFSDLCCLSEANVLFVIFPLF